MRSDVPHQGAVHLVEAIAIQMNIQVIRNIYFRVAQQAGENLHIHPLVVAICSERMPKDMVASILDFGLIAGSFEPPSKLFICHRIVGFPMVVKNKVAFGAFPFKRLKYRIVSQYPLETLDTSFYQRM